ncbi:MAG: Gamma-glutamyltranspeptidase [Alphaproteobacteria bacterium MarineAlpha6_Bin2]|mgnify:FL=1|nr:MAG: Gamma-glutamyltranspeptidase [Alphaproteobacteria bacterium MarineAlpha6_Bin2]
MSKLYSKFFLFIFYCISLNTSIAETKNILVSTANPLASQAGRDILLGGGNAIDAAVAVQLVLNLVEPQSSGLGGGGFLLYFDNKNKNLIFYDGRETAPSKIKKEHFLDKNGQPLSFYDAAVGGLAVGVPGLVSMLELVHKEYGMMKWESLFKPAINLSLEGFPISSRLHNQIKKDNYLHLIPNTSKYFYENTNIPKKVGYILKNKEFAETLKIISVGRSKAFYQGNLAKEIISTIQNSPIRKGVMNLEDLKNYKAIKQNPICGKYRKYKVCSASLPSAGGFSIIQILGILENFTLSKNTIKKDIHLILEASKYSYLDRFKYLGDPSFNAINLKKFLSDEYLKNIASKISTVDAIKLNFGVNKQLNNQRSTTHFSIKDQYGNIVSMTSSIENSFGSRLMAGGFLLNNQLSDFNFKQNNGLYKNNIVEPGKKPLSSMSPTIIFDEKNNVKMVIGSPGGKSIIMYVIKAIIAVIDWNMPIKDAVNFPNFSLENNIVLLEKKRFDEEIKKYLLSLGHTIEEKKLNSGLHGFEMKKNIISGAADKRREGLVLVN